MVLVVRGLPGGGGRAELLSKDITSLRFPNGMLEA